MFSESCTCAFVLRELSVRREASGWESLPPMSEPRGGDANGDPNIAACVLGDFLYVTRRPQDYQSELQNRGPSPRCEGATKSTVWNDSSLQQAAMRAMHALLRGLGLKSRTCCPRL